MVPGLVAVTAQILMMLGIPVSSMALHLFKRQGERTNSSQAKATWRAFACLTPFIASDGTPLFMLYGGTSELNVENPLNLASNGLNELQTYNINDQQWHLPSIANVPDRGPVLPGCGAASDLVWVYDTHYGTSNSQATTVGLLDSVHWSWSTPTQNGQLPVTRFGAAFAYVPKKQAFFMHGGIPLTTSSNTADSPPGIANNMDYLDPATLSWSYASNGPARKYHTLCYMDSIQSLVLFGGSDQNIAGYNDVKLFSVKDNAWQYSVNITGNVPSERVLHSAVCTKDTMYVFGGTHSIDDEPSDSTVWMLTAVDRANLMWTKAPISGESQRKGPAARFGHSAAIYNDHMYIFGGVGPNSQDSVMYKLDLKSLEWTAENNSESQNGDSVNTRVLIAAVISSVLGIISVGVAAFVIYRWSRRKNQVLATEIVPPLDQMSRKDDNDGILPGKSNTGYSSALTQATSSETDFANKNGGGSTALVPAMWKTSNGHNSTRDGYREQYDDPNFLLSSFATATGQHRRAGDIVSNDYLPPPHSNPSLGSSYNSLSPSSPHTWTVAGTSNRNSGNDTPDNISPFVSLGDSAFDYTQRNSNPHSPEELISAIIASGKTIPAWIREAASRPSNDTSASLQTQSADLSNRQSQKHLVASEGYNERKSAHSISTSGMQSASACEPIRYVNLSRTSTEETGVCQNETVQQNLINNSATKPSRYHRRHSDPSEADTDSYSVPGSLALGPVSLGAIAQPLVPPVPPLMNSLYGELENSGIIVGQAGIPAAVATIGHHVSVASLPPSNTSDRQSALNNDQSILSPLDRLARYHNIDAWMSPDADHKHQILSRRSSNETEDTSHIYAAQLAHQSNNDL
ncbi:hypothetical protein IWW36_003499 [Coemansia brasiliensis]|uniref:Galactose oxidase n=1 Tax=Coemansia brasiliensis TaxID=2650707 RepID=A0A9W8I5B6_9FUNG|nr:hypothetical protein IWW36_003499 [Coemansia brasiliensis]